MSTCSRAINIYNLTLRVQNEQFSGEKGFILRDIDLLMNGYKSNVY